MPNVTERLFLELKQKIDLESDDGSVPGSLFGDLVVRLQNGAGSTPFQTFERVHQPQNGEDSIHVPLVSNVHLVSAEVVCILSLARQSDMHQEMGDVQEKMKEYKEDLAELRSDRLQG